MIRPVFFDPSGRRRVRARRILLALLALLSVACAVFATTVLDVPTQAPLPIGYERLTPLPLPAQLSHLRHRVSALLPAGVRAAPPHGHPLTLGFYTPEAEDGVPSLRRHIGQLDWIAPTLLGLSAAGRLEVRDDPALRQVIGGSLHRPLVIPVLQNLQDGEWSGATAARMLHDAGQRRRLELDIAAHLAASGDAGILFDLENLPDAALPDLVRLVAETRARLAPAGRLVAVTMPIDAPAWPARALARAADKLVLMAYDEHWEGGTPGPIASEPWFAARLAATVAGLPADRVIVALGNYAYDWHAGQAEALTVAEAWLTARDSEARPRFVNALGNAAFSYADGGVRHDVWLLDAAASWNELHVLRQLGLANVALWRLGSEDPGFWSVLARWRSGAGRPTLTTIAPPQTVDVAGSGEILRIAATPQAGRRQLTYAPRGERIVDERFLALPTPFEVQRTGNRPRLVALTFDDGPDPTWTPRILDVLERFHVPATFFIVGENGVAQRGLLRRIAEDGDEIGNHSYTHPNMAEEAPAGIGLELNATQRLIEAYTGRSTRLFRAPYFGDAEPTTADELQPALVAQRRGYTVVGLHVDPGDWQRPGTAAIVARTIAGVEHPAPGRSGNVVLLHDGGGDRAQTLAALPLIIARLEHDGYRLVPVSTLAGLGHDQVMPRVEGIDLAAVRADVFLFGAIGAGLTGLNWLFFFAIALGLGRAVLLTGLALLPGRIRPRACAVPFRPTVTVIIPAYNEERVIAAAVRRVLDSDYPDIELIVADDGSRDRTSAIVAATFGSEPRMRLLTLANGGKAAALNRALAEAHGEVIVALDADTQFEPACIGRLVRWFADSAIGAVAGHAKVGNRVNLVTRWQAVEYVTAQTIERRALARFDAIMVVPGAVGAWRRAALDAVGGYPEDTLAEDQDLTIAVQRAGWTVVYDEEAVAWTEAPESFAALSRQRFRWSFGTLQCLWKHRAVLARRQPGGLATVGMPQAWLFQIAFALVSPLIDLALAVSIGGTALRVLQHGWAQTQTDVLRMGAYWLAFTVVDLLCGFVAFRLDVRRERFRPLLLLAQRFVYRQLMYVVVIRAVAAAWAGRAIGWGKLERSGRVSDRAVAGPLDQREAQPRDQPPRLSPASVPNPPPVA
ncbi:glycosyltransferase [Novosphingobium piscinae]|uniref:Chitooligosaccharide deacetylase n=1 Tax=Novosphingobium piscinae TaxID=1507448 RepID=A0A7X1G056_9SPHN|nr:glycosyltransferase [Novosphingobium piscinae]MBC2670180.1 glycosyltransferase [Novosphingobium piscinae]